MRYLRGDEAGGRGNWLRLPKLVDDLFSDPDAWIPEQLR